MPWRSDGHGIQDNNRLQSTTTFPPQPVLRLYIQMRYEWDEEKNRLNRKKHRVSFEMAALAFEDERCLVRPDRVDETGEQR